MSYVTNFYKAKEHNYEGFFSKFTEGEESIKAKAELNSLLKLVEEKTSAYTAILNKRYNVHYTPIDKNVVLSYQNRDGAIFYFDASNGFPVSGVDNDCEHITLGTKAGDFSYVSGYCYDLGAVLVKSYIYSVNSNNSKVVLKLQSETLVPMFDEHIFKTKFDGIEFSDVTSCNYSDHNINHALNRTNATTFIQNFYGVDKKFSFNLGSMRCYLYNNKSFEVIIRTCDNDELMETLLNFKVDKAVPLHEIIGASKADWSYAQELGVLNRFVQFKDNIKNNEYYSSKRFNEAISKTDKEWIEFIEKVKHWEEDLSFYTIGYRGDLFNTLVHGYVGGDYPFYYSGLPKYYPFGKFCTYVVEESINQGYTSIENFIKTLADYIKMCCDLNVVPTLYSSYLSQTHDIVARNHKIKLQAEQEEIFNSRYAGFKPYEDEEYTIVCPTSSNDLQKEGDSLNHCVASYIKRVVDGECIILFLRKITAPLESLVTLEMRKNSIVQARGLHNRAISESERIALYRFSKKSGITVRV